MAELARRMEFPAPDGAGELVDLRFRRLVGEEAWGQLPVAVQQRFSKRLAGEAVALYRGRIIEARRNQWGWLLAQALRLVGAPLPLSMDKDVAAVVSVSEDARFGGQVWSRLYARRDGFPQVIHSAKRFAGPSGLEEYVGRGIGMALKVEAFAEGLRFVSDHYVLKALGRRWRLPRWLAPGRCVVVHHDRGDGAFLFSLSLIHPLFGELIWQQGEFRDA